MTKISYILIDYENVQPRDEDFDLIPESDWHVKMFLGPQHKRIQMSVAAALQPLGKSVQYSLLEKSGKNASDFRIVYQLGVLSSRDPSAAFYIISDDEDFDSLLEYLRTKSVSAYRCSQISDVPFPKSDPQPGSKSLKRADGLQRAVEILRGLEKSHCGPRTLAKLENTLRSKVPTSDSASLIKLLQKQKHISIAEKKVSYHFADGISAAAAA